MSMLKLHRLMMGRSSEVRRMNFVKIEETRNLLFASTRRCLVSRCSLERFYSPRGTEGRRRD